MPYCPGSEVTGTISATASECNQVLRARAVDRDTGETLSTSDSHELSEGESVDLPFSFTMPWKSVPLKVIIERRVGEEWTAVGSKNVDVGLTEPASTIHSLDVPGELCPGTSFEGSTGATAERCNQTLRITVVNSDTGETVSRSDSVSLSEGETFNHSFSSEMPGSDLPLRAILERREEGTWRTVDTTEKTIGLIPLETSAGDLRAPSELCAGTTREASVAVTAESCSQRTRARFVDVEAGRVVQDWREKALGEGEEGTFTCSFTMPWRDLTLRADVERRNPVTGNWVGIASRSAEVAQKTPATGIAPVEGREIPEFARPGYGLSGACEISNAGECEGNIRATATLEGNRIARNTWTLGPGESEELSFSTEMPPLNTATLDITVESARKRGMTTTQTFPSLIRAITSIILTEGQVSIHGGPYKFAGIIVAEDVDVYGLRKPEEIPVKIPEWAKARAVPFVGRVGSPPETRVITFEAGSLVYLRIRTTEKVSYGAYETLVDRDTKNVTYQAVEKPGLKALSRIKEWFPTVLPGR